MHHKQMLFLHIQKKNPNGLKVLETSSHSFGSLCYANITLADCLNNKCYKNGLEMTIETLLNGSLDTRIYVLHMLRAFRSPRRVAGISFYRRHF
jgi:hypothetical protein